MVGVGLGAALCGNPHPNPHRHPNRNPNSNHKTNMVTGLVALDPSLPSATLTLSPHPNPFNGQLCLIQESHAQTECAVRTALQSRATYQEGRYSIHFDKNHRFATSKQTVCVHGCFSYMVVFRILLPYRYVFFGPIETAYYLLNKNR